MLTYSEQGRVWNTSRQAPTNKANAVRPASQIHGRQSSCPSPPVYFRGPKTLRIRPGPSQPFCHENALEVKSIISLKWLIWFCSVKPLAKQWWFGMTRLLKQWWATTSTSREWLSGYFMSTFGLRTLRLLRDPVP